MKWYKSGPVARRGSSPPREPVSRSAVPDSYQQLLPPLSTSIKSSRYFTINFSFLELSPRTHKSEGQFPCQWNQKDSHIRVSEKESLSESTLCSSAGPKVQKGNRSYTAIWFSCQSILPVKDVTTVTEMKMRFRVNDWEKCFQQKPKVNPDLRLWFRLEGCAIQLWGGATAASRTDAHLFEVETGSRRNLRSVCSLAYHESCTESVTQESWAMIQHWEMLASRIWGELNLWKLLSLREIDGHGCQKNIKLRRRFYLLQ